VLAFMYIPLFVVIINSFNAQQLSSWPIEDFSLYWWEFAANYEPIRLALLNSVIVATVAMVIASVLGTLVAFALNRYEFFGKSTVNLLVVSLSLFPALLRVSLFLTRTQTSCPRSELISGISGLSCPTRPSVLSWSSTTSLLD